MSHVARQTVLLVAVMFLAGCTDAERAAQETALAAAPQVAEGFVQDWIDADRAGLTEATGDAKAVRRFLRSLRKAEIDGAIAGFDVTIDETVEPPSFDELGEADDLVIGVPYTIEWSSEAVSETAALDGAFEMTYSRADEAWTPKLDRSLLWPGIEGAAGFEVYVTLLRRGSIFDRNGNVLARSRGARRIYPQGEVGGTAVGHLERLSDDVAAGAAGMEVGALVGGSGIEAALEDTLSGSPRAELVVVDPDENELTTLVTDAGSPGDDVTTTLDIDVQRAAQMAFGDITGGAVLIEPDTGDLLAVVSSSPFDPGTFVGAEGFEPFNRALSGLYPPGSSMKVVTAAAALDSGTFTATSQVTGPREYKGVTNFESGTFGSITFGEALQNSVNTAFAQIAEELGAGRLHDYAESFGFNEPPGMMLDAATSSYPLPAGLGDLMWSSVGQAQVLASPLQMASVAATVANKGQRMEPRIDADAPPAGERVVSAKTARVMTGLMERVVQSGTGVNAQVPGVRVAGKTGTAEVDVEGERMNHAWFVSFAPAGRPKVALAVVSELGGIGGQVAAPLAQRILTAVLPLL
jgi:peptidoglycan glycosyltransferase